MAPLLGLTLIKQFTYRGDPLEEYSNTYHFTGDPPAASVNWKANADALIASEKTLYPADVTVIRAYGYDSDAEDAPAVWSWDYLAQGTQVAGTLSIVGTAAMPGDSACQVRWKTDRLNSKGKPVYLRKYFHPATQSGSSLTDRDKIGPAQLAALNAFALGLENGTTMGSKTLRSRTHADTIVSHAAGLYVTTRTLKRRGKRPNS